MGRQTFTQDEVKRHEDEVVRHRVVLWHSINLVTAATPEERKNRARTRMSVARLIALEIEPVLMA